MAVVTRRRSRRGRSRAYAPVPVFVAPGLGGERHLTQLRADHRVRIVRSPRHADLLVVAGALPREAIPALHAVHDQIPAPRGVAAIGVDGDLDDLGLACLRPLTDREVVPHLQDLHGEVLAGRGASPTLGPVDHPVDWQGQGPHGQGGEGMMGGTPYGRPMAMPPVEGRDGLALDRLALRLGPFLPGLPIGVTLQMGLQGDVLAELDIEVFDVDDLVGVPRPDERPLAERTAGRRLSDLAELCALCGLDAFARATARLALDAHREDVARLGRRLDRPWALRAATDGVGRLEPDALPPRMRPAASGPLDTTARWRRWFDEAAADADPSDVVPITPLDADERAELASALVGGELGRVLVTLASLRRELEPRPAVVGSGTIA